MHPRRRRAAPLFSLLLVLGGVATSAFPGRASGLREADLVGTWHVLIHYTDANTSKPDLVRWKDEVWVLEPDAGKLRWTVYPIVVFADESGRFEGLGTNRASRVLHAWEPNPGQLEQIRSGLEVNPRGSSTKTLRRSGGSWRSASSARPVAVSVFTYQEDWAIEEGEAGRPVFGREDTLQTLDDATRDRGGSLFETTAVEDGGGVLRGTFERDDTRRGTFRMTRAGPVRDVRGSGGSQSERLREAMIQNWRQIEAEEVPTDGDSPGDGEGGGKPPFPSKGLTLEETLAGIHQRPTAYYTLTLRKLEILRLEPDGFEEIDYDDLQSGAVEVADDGDYAVIALVFCRTANGSGEDTSWYLLEDNSLAAWDHYRHSDDCVYSNDYEPAERERVALEARVTSRVREAFPRPRVHDIVIYQKGLELVRVGRTDDAEGMLALADEENLDSEDSGLDSRHTGIRARISSPTDRDSMRARLVQAIEAAKRVQGADPVSAN